MSKLSGKYEVVMKQGVTGESDTEEAVLLNKRRGRGRGGRRKRKKEE